MDLPGNTTTLSTWREFYTVTELDPKFSEWRCGYCRKKLGRDEHPSVQLCPRCGCSLSVRVATTTKPHFIEVTRPTVTWTNNAEKI